MKAASAEIILPALKHGAVETERLEGASEHRQILPDQLLLQIDRVGRDDRLFAGGQRVKNARNEVTEAFSDAGSSFYQQVLFLTEGFSDGGGHLLLLRAKLEIAASGKDAGGGKEIANLFNEVLANGCVFQSTDQTNEVNS